MSCFLFLSYAECWICFNRTVVWGRSGEREVGRGQWCHIGAFSLTYLGKGRGWDVSLGVTVLEGEVRPASAMLELLFPCWFSCASSTCGGFTTLDGIFFFGPVQFISTIFILFFLLFPFLSTPPSYGLWRTNSNPWMGLMLLSKLYLYCPRGKVDSLLLAYLWHVGVTELGVLPYKREADTAQ